MSTEAQIRDRICFWGESLHRRGLTSGSSGNISVRLADCIIATPTNSCLGMLDPATLSRLDLDGRLLSGDRPTKEVPLHLGFYAARPQAAAVVHLHSSHATAWSCRADIDTASAFPPLTPYVLMRAGQVPVLPYFPPGSTEIRRHVEAAALRHAAVLLANHGPVVSGPSLDAAVYAAEEVEEIARVAFILEGRPVNLLAEAEIARLIG